MKDFRFNDGRDWFFEKRFGLFIHFGLYAVGGWHEQEQCRRAIPRDRYVRALKKFNPENFDPHAIINLAENVGMEYLCITAKHHDGFCLWNTSQTDYSVMHSPYGKDLIRQLADACHERNFPLGLYYSIVDWHHPSYPNSGRPSELQGPEDGDCPDWEKYMEYLKAQVRELCTDYGEIHHFFWDMNVPEYADASINDMIRKLQPNAVINDRGFDEGDCGTSERDYDADSIRAMLRFDRPMEACNSLGSQSWGYRKDEDYYSARYLMGSIDGILARGGNYLLSVGPMKDGSIPTRAAELLKIIGSWYWRIKESFAGTEPASELTDNRKVFITRRDNILYVHLAGIPDTEAVILDPLDVLPREATVLNTDEQARADVILLPSFWRSGKKCLRIHDLPVDQQTDEVMVIRLDFDTLPERLPD